MRTEPVGFVRASEAVEAETGLVLHLFGLGVESASGGTAMDHQKTLRLTEQALEDLDAGRPLSLVLEKALRVARLMGDAASVLRWSMETRTAEDKALGKQILEEVKSRPPEEAMRRMGEDYGTERLAQWQRDENGGSAIIQTPLAELEAMFAREETFLSDHEAPTTEFALIHNDFAVVLGRIRTRLHHHLTMVESSLEAASPSEDIWNRNRAYVESRIRTLSSATVGALRTAEKVSPDASREERSQSLLSCRRTLKFLADDLCPGDGRVVAGFDGVEREMQDGQYRQRLTQYAYEHSRSETGKTLLIAQLEKLSAYIEALDKLAHKGVHGSVTDFEVNQCVIQTYLTVGDLLRLGDTEAVPHESDNA
jgi:hypothetical protein